MVFLRRDSHYSTYRRQDGQEVVLWTTFGATDPSEQIDLDVRSEGVRKYLTDLLDFMHDKGIRYIRLDAVGFINKVRSTDCFMVEPFVSDFIRWYSDEAQRRNIGVLSEVHDTQETRRRLADQGFTGYDFLLPMAVLQTLISRNADLLMKSLQDRPDNLVTILDCHDGIPMQPDMGDLLDARQACQVVKVCEERKAQFSRLVGDHRLEECYPKVHQVCGTLYSLLGEDDDAFVIARAIQLFVPGIPQVYYAGLLAGLNDEEQCHAEQDERALNRHNYTEAEIEAAVQKPAVQRVMRLIRLRRSHPAFQGVFSGISPESGHCELAWSHGEIICRLEIDLTAMKAKIFCQDEQGTVTVTDV